MPLRTVSDPDYWNDLYIARETGWDKGRAAPPIVRLLDEGLVPDGGTLVVFGAGRGHDALYAARVGLEVTAVDFAEEAANHTRASARAAQLDLEVLEENVFALPTLRPHAFDAALEHTAFCAIDPTRRPDYVEMVHAVLRPGGLFFGLFYAHGRPGGPPFATTEDEIRELYEPRFTVERLKIADDSFPSRSGEELEFVFRRKD